MGKWAAILAAIVAGWSIAAAAQTSRFDGRWDVALACPPSPDGALPFTWQFAANVRGGVLHGEYGVQGHPASMALDGIIQPDGSARLQAHGLTGQPAYNIAQTSRGVPFAHDVTARFDQSRGSGIWVTPRTCSFAFTHL